jgi:threonine dehydrogenase-like Zn-dependent dehydrogenase
VVVVEPNPRRRAFASERGSIGVEPTESERLVREITNGDGADLVIEAGGIDATLRAAFGLCRKRGRIVSVGVHAQETWAFPLARAFADEIALRFAIGDSIRYRRRLLTLIASGTLDIADVVQSHVGIDNAARGYAEMQRGEILKAVVDLRG